MIVEYIRYQIRPDKQAAFVADYATAQEALKASPHCLGYELSQCVEEADSFILRIEWDSVEGHLQGFRQSAEFQRFFAAIRSYVNDIQEMSHYMLTNIRS